MTCTVAWTERSKRDLERLPPPLRSRIVAKVCEAAEDPHRFFRRLQGRREHRLRVGDHCVIALLLSNPDVVAVQAVRHRKNAYA